MEPWRLPLVPPTHAHHVHARMKGIDRRGYRVAPGWWWWQFRARSRLLWKSWKDHLGHTAGAWVSGSRPWQDVSNRLRIGEVGIGHEISGSVHGA